MGISLKMPKLGIKSLKPKGINFKGFKLKKRPSKKVIILGSTPKCVLDSSSCQEMVITFQ